MRDPARRPVVGVIGESAFSDRSHERLAEAVGRGVAEAGCVLLCGGLSGVMEAASRGARQAGGLTVGLLPGTDAVDANPDVMVAIPTGMGQARNALIALASDVVVAIGGGYGTLSEIAHALRLERPVVGLRTWRAEAPGVVARVRHVQTADEALDALRELLRR